MLSMLLRSDIFKYILENEDVLQIVLCLFSLLLAPFAGLALMRAGMVVVARFGGDYLRIMSPRGYLKALELKKNT